MCSVPRRDPALSVRVDPAELEDPAQASSDALRAFVISRDPRITVVPNFLSPTECEHFKALASFFWTQSRVALHDSPEDYVSDNLHNNESATRTSSSCMLRSAQTSVVEEVEYRLAGLAQQPVEHLERLNMVRYAPGQFFAEHHDGKFRPATVFLYLNDLRDDDGETHFTELGLKVVPRRGCAVMWANQASDGSEDHRLLHAALAPRTQWKYGINAFFNVREMRKLKLPEQLFAPEHSTVVDLRQFCEMDASSIAIKRNIFVLKRDPKIAAMPMFLNAEEVDHISELVGDVAEAAPEAHSDTDVVKAFGFGQTALLAIIEERIAEVAGLPLTHLGSLMVVRGGTRHGLCNRGTGPNSAIVSLATDVVYFPALGLQLLLRSGDFLMWPNVDWRTGFDEEDLRTTRFHRLPPVIRLDAHFHDAQIRLRQRDSQALASSAGPG